MNSGTPRISHGQKSTAFVWFVRVLIVLGIFGIFPLIIASFYNHPSADDFSYSVLTHVAAQTGSPFEVVKAAFLTTMSFMESWQGLYSSAFVLALQPAIFGEDWYFLTCPLLLLVTSGGFLLFFRSASKYILGSDSRAWIAVALLSWFFFVQTMPSPSQGLYWYNGAMNYLFFWSLGLVTVGLMIGFCATKGPRSCAALFIATLLAFIVAGGNHVSSFACILALALIALVCIVRQRRFAALLPFVVCVIGFVIVMTAPGTAIRAEALADVGVERSVIWTLVRAPYATLSYLDEWINLSLLCLFGALTPFLYRLVKTSRSGKRLFSLRNAMLVGVGSLMFLAAILCVPLYSLHGLGEGRLTDIVYATFVILCTSFFFMLFAVFVQKLDGLVSFGFLSVKGAVSVAVFSLLFAMTFILPSTGARAIGDLLNGSMAAYDAQLDARQVPYLDSAVDNVVVPALDENPSLIFFDDITGDPSDWRNTSTAAYYDKDSVMLELPNSEEASSQE